MPPEQLLGMHALVQELAPGGRLVSSRRLRGGLDANMHVITIELPGGSRLKVALRRFVHADWREHQPEAVARGFERLRLVERTGIPAPRPLLLDVEGRFFGVPALVQSYLPGAPLWAKRDVEDWAVELARGASMIHAITPASFDLTGLPVYSPEEMRASHERKREDLVQGDGLMSAIHETLEKDVDRITAMAPTLIHTDYHPGNTVWLRRKLTGVLDWTGAALGDRRIDVAQGRVDLVISHHAEAGDIFTDAYERLSSTHLADLWFFDLDRGLGALLSFREWLGGYHDAGLTHLTEEDCDARLRAFLHEALQKR